jgi:hypothetical protein
MNHKKPDYRTAVVSYWHLRLFALYKWTYELDDDYWIVARKSMEEEE